ncbi:MAG: DNA primase [Bacteroidales bacterium]|nr:DNA primase [Bacteroidales bacterium]
MARIDKATIDRILDATDIVDVVSDFVSLKKHGSSYLGLCPFHNDRSPSFSVSRSRGIFKCFSCGKAGNTVSFLMDLENMTYVEAIKWLARKYNIEIQERELTSAERQAQAERESMYAVNDFAMSHFERTLADTEDGRDIGLSYFHERGIGDAMIRKFHLGYALDVYDDLYKKAVAAGFSDKYLVDTGLCIRNDRGKIYDRFKGRVIYPVHSLSGRVVAFGGRTLSKEKTVAKYVNSPESVIYSKSNELYGMYQARNAIARKKKCILVEGYMDVISMHQAGVENVVASSGTSLTDGQVRMIKRFADTVTLIYDSDHAGIKAALRGINMFVAAGLALRIVLLPEGDDPDSFAQHHSSAEVEQYIAEHEQDLISFKVDVLMREADADPRSRTEAINDILTTISLIPDVVERDLYLDRCSTKVGVSFNTLAAQLGRFITRRAEEEAKRRNQQHDRRQADLQSQAPVVGDVVDVPSDNVPVTSAGGISEPVRRAEHELITYVLRHGAYYLCDVYTDDDDTRPVPMTVIDYVKLELERDGVTFSHPDMLALWQLACEIRFGSYDRDLADNDKRLQQRRERAIAAGQSEICDEGLDMETIKLREDKLIADADADYLAATDEFSDNYIQQRMLRIDDRRMVELVAGMTSEPVQLSKMYPKVDLREDLLAKLPTAVNSLKGAIIKDDIYRLEQQLRSTPVDDVAALERVMRELYEKKLISMEFDKNLGEIVITPHRH